MSENPRTLVLLDENTKLVTSKWKKKYRTALKDKSRTNNIWYAFR